jgi:hypothetical protein
MQPSAFVPHRREPRSVLYRMRHPSSKSRCYNLTVAGQNIGCGVATSIGAASPPSNSCVEPGFLFLEHSLEPPIRHRANHRLAETRKENVQFLVHQKCVYLRQDAFALVVHGQTQCIRAKYPTIVNSATAAAMTPRAQTSGPAARCPYLTFTAYVLGRSMVIALSPEIFGSH